MPPQQLVVVGGFAPVQQVQVQLVPVQVQLVQVVPVQLVPAAPVVPYNPYAASTFTPVAAPAPLPQIIGSTAGVPQNIVTTSTNYARGGYNCSAAKLGDGSFTLTCTHA